MIGDEPRVVQAFKDWLFEHGWTLQETHQHAEDVRAERNGQVLIGEAKGRTENGDVDTGYGQLLRRMTDASDRTRYAIIVPTELLPAARRVPVQVRRQLRIDLYEVTDDNTVIPHSE